MKIKKDLPKVEPVKIKPLLGIKPGIWLTVLYVFILMALVFVICFLPGLVHKSERVTFESNAYNAAVYIDGNYAGGTPFTSKVQSGNHFIEYKVNGVILDSFEINVPNKVFLSWLFPGKMDVFSDKSLNKEAYDLLVKELFEDLILYSAVTEYDSVHRYPDLYMNFAKSIKNCSIADTSVLSDYAVCFATSEEMRQDAQMAFGYLGLSFSFETLKENVPVVAKNQVASPIELGGIKGFDFGSFKIAQTAVTEQQYMEFVSENPYWNKSNREQLINDKMVNEYYLDDVGTSEIRPVRNISYHAAKAYCVWLSNKTGHNVFLSSETMWMTSGSLADSWQKTIVINANDGKLAGMLGGVWELTDTVFIPFNSGKDVESFIRNLEIPFEIIVKGGSFVNKEKTADLTTRGLVYDDVCSDYMGFRIAWI